MKRKISILLILSMLLLIGCQANGTKEEEAVKKPIKIMEVKEEPMANALEYVGVIVPEELSKLSFKSSGRIASIKVKAGESVKKNQSIVLLDSQDISYQVEAARAGKNAAQAQYEKAINGATEEELEIAMSNAEKAKKAYDFASDNYEKMLKIYEAGGISQKELEGLKLELDISQEDYNAASTILNQVEKGAREEDKQYIKAQLDQAKVDLSHKQSLMQDANMKANIDGYVMDLLYEEGEMVGAGYPVVILGSQNSILSFGLTQADLNTIDIGHEVEVLIEGKDYQGTIKSIEKIMDTKTRTFNAEVLLKDESLPSGAIGKVYIKRDEHMAIKIPITSIMRSSYDYVYLVYDDMVKRKKIELGQVEGEYIEVIGLIEGEKLVIEGMKNLNENDLIIVKD